METTKCFKDAKNDPYINTSFFTVMIIISILCDTNKKGSM